MFSLGKILKRSHLHKEDEAFLLKIKTVIGFTPRNLNLYKEAFTHPSCMNDVSVISYERLEFLGDSVLGAVISDYLFQKYPDKDEGYLTKMRSKIVQRESLNHIGEKLDLVSMLHSKVHNGNLGNNIQGDLLEALVGAIYLDKGYEISTEFVKNKIIDSVSDIKNIENKVISYKSLILEWSQKNKKSFLIEVEQDENDVSSNKYFVSRLFIDGVLMAKARETSKKRSEEKAAKRAFYKIREDIHHSRD